MKKRKKDKRLIPHGFYCYTLLETCTKNNKLKMKVKPCPYWSIRKGKRSMENGYCSYIGKGDWEWYADDIGIGHGPDLLWDGVKECGINEPTQKEMEEECSRLETYEQNKQIKQI